jgi:hypothetical protein
MEANLQGGHLVGHMKQEHTNYQLNGDHNMLVNISTTH